MDDVAGAASCTEQELGQFLTFAFNFHLKLEYTCMVYLQCQTPVLGYLHNTPRWPLYIYLNITEYTRTKQTATPTWTSARRTHLTASWAIPHSQFLRLRKICSEDDDFEEAANSMETFFAARGYPIQIVENGREKAASTPRATLSTMENRWTGLLPTEFQWW